MTSYHQRTQEFGFKGGTTSPNQDAGQPTIAGLKAIESLTFNSVHGKNISISSDRIRATRVSSSQSRDDMAFSNRPIAINEKVFFRIVDTSATAYVSFGFTTFNPERIDPLPIFLHSVIFSPGYWGKSLENSLLKKDNILSFYVNYSGEVHFQVNEEKKGIFVNKVDITKPLWALIDIFGENTTVGLVKPTEIHHEHTLPDVDNLVDTITSLSIAEEVKTPLKYTSPLEPLSFHKTRGINILEAKDGIATRVSYEICQGYVFSADPIHPKQIFIIQILNTDYSFASSLTIGFTACDPSKLRPSELPSNVNKLKDRPESWFIKTDVANGLQTEDELTVIIGDDGEVHISKNGRNSFTSMRVDLKEKLWVFVDVYGATQNVKIMCGVADDDILKALPKKPEQNVVVSKPLVAPKPLVQLQRVRGRRVSSTTTASVRTAHRDSNNISFPLMFHSVHGKNISISSDRSRATRVSSSQTRDDLAFCSRPIAINEKVFLRIIDTSATTNVSFGFTTFDPNQTDSLPMFLHSVISLRGYWGKIVDKSLLQKDNILSFYVNYSGEVHFQVNGKEKGIFLKNVDITKPLWALINIFGEYTTIGLVKPTEINHLKQTLLEVDSLVDTIKSLSIPEELKTPLKYTGMLEPLSFHITRGINILKTKDGIATRLSYEICQGYVFSANPIHPKQIFIIQILSTDFSFASSSTIGFTACDPSKLRPSELPSNVNKLKDRPESWFIKTDVANGLQRNDELTVIIDDYGEVHISKNGGNPFTSMRVDLKEKLWVFVDMYGATQKVKMMCGVADDDVLKSLSKKPEQNIVVSKPLIAPKPVLLRKVSDSVSSTTTASVRKASRDPDNISLPLIFHSVHGKNISISSSGYRAERLLTPDTSRDDVAFSNRPIKINEKISFRIAEISDAKSSYISFGLTTQDPGASSSLPKFIHSVIFLPGYWAKVLNKDFYKKDNILTFHLNISGDVNFQLNREDKGVVFSGVSIENPVWFIMDLFGESVAVELIDERKKNIFQFRENEPTKKAIAQNDTQKPRIVDVMHVPALSFHTVRSKNMRNPRNFIAHLIEMQSMPSNGVAFMSRPITIGEEINVYITKAKKPDTLIAIGFTHHNPASLASVPDKTTKDLHDNKEYWVEDIKEEFCLQNNHLKFSFDFDGNVHIAVNGVDKGLLTLKVDIRKPLWPFLRISEYETEVSLELPYDQQRQKYPQVPLSIQEVKDLNKSISDSARDVTESQNYIFSKDRLRPGQVITIQILASNASSSENLRLGFISKDPASLYSSSEDISLESKLLDFWQISTNNAKAFKDYYNLSICVRYDVVLVYVNLLLIKTLYISFWDKIWLFVDGFGSTHNIKLWSTQERTPDISAADNASSSDLSIASTSQDGRLNQDHSRNIITNSPSLSEPTLKTSQTSNSSAEASNSSSISRSGNVEPKEPIVFHSVHGDSIVINGTRATYTSCMQTPRNGLVFTNRPIRIDEKISIRIVGEPHWMSYIALGFTSHNPTTIAKKLPDHMFSKDTVPGYWAKLLDKNYSENGTLICFYFTYTGEIQLEIDGEEKGTIITGVDVSNSLWAFFDIFGDVSVELDCKLPKLQSFGIPDNLSTLKYHKHIKRIRLHKTKGLNIDLRNDFVIDDVAYRKSSAICQGYIFTKYPVCPNQTVLIQILGSDPSLYAGSLAIGLTSCDPSTITDLPDHPELLLSRPEYWVVRSDCARGLSVGDELAITLKENGEVVLSNNGGTPFTAMHVDTTQLLWGFVDVYGATRKVRLMCEVPPPKPQGIPVLQPLERFLPPTLLRSTTSATGPQNQRATSSNKTSGYECSVETVERRRRYNSS